MKIKITDNYDQQYSMLIKVLVVVKKKVHKTYLTTCTHLAATVLKGIFKRKKLS